MQGGADLSAFCAGSARATRLLDRRRLLAGACTESSPLYSDLTRAFSAVPASCTLPTNPVSSTWAKLEHVS